MKTITKMELQPGMIIGEPIIDKGKTLYEAGTEVNHALISRLNRYDVLCITIMEDIDLATTHYEIIRFDDGFKTFEMVYPLLLNQYKTIMKQFLYTGVTPADSELLAVYNELYSQITSGALLLDYLYNLMPNEDELTYTHCLNVALLAGTFADWMGMDDETKNTLILCGFYYDIGKLQLPYHILWKPDALTAEEYKIVKQHPVVGYSMIRNTNLNAHIKNTILMHHERLDGSGYPYQIKGDDIDIFSRYIAIADAYIAMASPRAHRNALTPLQILGILEKKITQYDVELLVPLMKKIANAQLGTTVQLNDGSIWDVFVLQPDKLSRPILRNDKNELLDLLERTDLEIVKNL